MLLDEELDLDMLET